LVQGRENRGVLRQPPLVVMWGRDNRGSYLGRPVTHLESPTLPPRYMDGADR
jgi:hypothetical protein